MKNIMFSCFIGFVITSSILFSRTFCLSICLIFPCFNWMILWLYEYCFDLPTTSQFFFFTFRKDQIGKNLGSATSPIWFLQLWIVRYFSMFVANVPKSAITRSRQNSLTRSLASQNQLIPLVSSNPFYTGKGTYLTMSIYHGNN